MGYFTTLRTRGVPTPIAVGTRLESRAADPGDWEDYGEVTALGDGGAVVRWHRSGEEETWPPGELADLVVADWDRAYWRSRPE